MADIRCPMCGKENPPDQEVCQFCQARLKPLILNPSPDEGGETYPDENSFLDGKDQAESALPGWLLELRPDESEFPDQASEDLQSEKQPISAEPLSDEGEDIPEWLSYLRDGADFEPDALGPAESEDSAAAAESFDLTQFGESPEDSSSDSLPDMGTPGDEQLPDWLDGLRSPGEQGEDAAEEREEDSDWLNRIRLLKGEDDRQEYMASLEEEGDVPEIVPSISAAQAEEPGIAPQPLDSEFEEPPVEADEFSFEELDQQLSEVETPLEDEPAWPGPDAEEPIEDAFVPAFDDKEILAEPSEPDPDWLSDFKEETPSVRKDDVVTEKLSDIPDWLTELMPEESPQPHADDQEPGVGPVEGEAAEVPDWLADFGGISVSESVEGETPAILPEGTLPLQLIEDAEAPPAGETEPRETIDQDAAGEEQPDEKQAESDLTPADLPSWVEAMRPVETGVPSAGDEESQIVETAGPLAGLSGVLSAKPDVAWSERPSAYSEKLQVSKEQRAHVDLLKGLIAGEAEARPIPKPSVISTQNVFRWVIALVLFLAILWPAITSVQQVPMPTFAPEIEEVNNLINGLPDNARILVAFDYQPGLSAEMDTAAAAVIDHIMLRGANLTLVSTSATGPLLAERFLSQTQSVHKYTRDEQYINMGYIPGGAAGLLSLAVSPQRTIPYTTDGVEAWETSSHNALPPLEGIDRLADFSMVVVIIDDPDTARAWVEQVQPYLSGENAETPLVMVVSTQAEPLVRPYFQASPQQIQGFVAGMRGGASYARLTGRGGLPRRYWDGFSAGLTVAAMLIAIGGMVNVASVLISSRKRDEGETES